MDVCVVWCYKEESGDYREEDVSVRSYVHEDGHVRVSAPALVQAC